VLQAFLHTKPLREQLLGEPVGYTRGSTIAQFIVNFNTLKDFCVFLNTLYDYEKSLTIEYNINIKNLTKTYKESTDGLYTKYLLWAKERLALYKNFFRDRRDNKKAISKLETNIAASLKTTQQAARQLFSAGNRSGQQDVHELATAIVDDLITPGTTTTTTKCLKCKKETPIIDKFNILDVPYGTPEKPIKISEAIASTLECPQDIQGYDCKSCPTRTIAQQKKEYRLPPGTTLIRLTRETGSGKNQTAVKVEDILTIGEKAYNLSAVILHAGHSASHGHYIALVRDPYNQNGWKIANDRQILDGQEAYTAIKDGRNYSKPPDEEFQVVMLFYTE
jgi:ubiquitin C-terminal hydrolase